MIPVMAEIVAADMLSQAEHDTMASAVLVTDSTRLADAVSAELERQIPLLPRAEIARASIDNCSKIILAESMTQAVEISNEIAPEHMEIVTANPFEDMMKVKKCRCDLYRRVQLRATGRLFCRSEPCASYKRNCQILLSPFRR
mgnify:CR=1 FL=1